ncbi:hypothetical protein ACFIOY_21580 [Bradyrhizobium sp. TZ2]
MNDWLAAKGDLIQRVNSQTATCAIVTVFIGIWIATAQSRPKAAAETSPHCRGALSGEIFEPFLLGSAMARRRGGAGKNGKS